MTFRTLLRVVVRWASVIVVFVGLGATTPAMSATISTHYGLDDGLGLGLMNGDALFSLDLASGTGVAMWGPGGRSVTMSANWLEPIQSANLEVFSGGWGLDAPARVYLNNQMVGVLTQADGDMTPSGENLAFRDVFNLNAFLAYLTGNDLIEIRTANAIDDGALGFLQLTVTTDDGAGGGNSIPEPAGWAIAALAFVAATRVSQRRGATSR